MEGSWPQDFHKIVRNFFEPRSVAIIGATEDTRYGRRMIENLVGSQLRGKVFPVNPKRSEIMGLPCFKSVTEIQEEVDLAIIVIPARAVLTALRECAEKGIRAVIIISAGFSERDGQAGRDRQKELQEFAKEKGIYLCGPNCLGIANLKDKIYPNSSGDLEQLLPAAGPIGVVSQSGATAFGPLMAKTKDRGSRLKYLVSTGNEADLEGTDFIRYMLDDPEILTLIAFIEGFKSGEKLKAVADLALERKKPILIMKMGRSETGGKAAMTHTAAITGSFKVHDSFFRQKGIVRVDDYDELCEVANLFSRRKFPQGNRVGIISHSGGICTFLSDECAENGFQVPSLSGETTEKINEILQGFGSCENPLDLTGAISGPRFPEILNAVIHDPHIDAVIVASRGDKKFASLIMDAAQETEKPLLFVWTHSEFDTEGLPAFREGGMPVFISPAKCIKALRHLREYHNFIQRHGDSAHEQKEIVERILAEPGMEEVKASLSGESGTSLPEGRCRKILEPLRLPFGPSHLCQSSAEAKRAAKTVGYPVVLKMDSSQILHKTESKGVILNIRGEQELISAFGEMKALGKAMDPPLTLNGIMVQKMISGGIELIVGVLADALFGPVLMLGWGGVFVEALGLAAWRVCPIGPEDARTMIRELPGLSKVLGGMRGKPALDTRALVDTMVKISAIAYALRKRVTSMDFNPVMVLPEGQGVALVDCRMILRPGP